MEEESEVTREDSDRADGEHGGQLWGPIGIDKFIQHRERKAQGWHGGTGCSSTAGNVRSLNFVVAREGKRWYA